jgi:Flp pilus assembly protein TadG
MNRRRQAGATTVEFAIIGLLAMVVMLSLIEFSRLVFVLNAMNEATRRGARMAAVCPVNDPAIAQVAVFNAPGDGGQSPVVHNLTPANVQLQYLNQAGAPLGTPAASFTQIRYVRVGIANLQHTLLIPLFNLTFTLPEFPSTLPRESLGIPRVGPGPLPC